MAFSLSDMLSGALSGGQQGATIGATVAKAFNDDDVAKRKAEADDRARKAEVIKQIADMELKKQENDRANQKNTREQGTYDQTMADKKTEAERLTLGNTANQRTLGDIASGAYNNPDVQITDPELVKEQAITAATRPSPFAQVAKPAGFNGANVSPFDTVAANKSVMGTIGNQGLGKLQQQVRDTTKSQFYKGQVGEFAGDNPNIKENMADFEKQDENAAAQAEKARLESEANKYKGADDARAQSALEETMRHNRATENQVGSKSGAGLSADASAFKDQLLNDPIKKQMVDLYAHGYLTEKEMMAKIPGFNKSSGAARLAMTEAAIEINPPRYDEGGELIGGFNPKGFNLSTKAMGTAASSDANIQNKKVSQAKDLQLLLNGFKDPQTGEYKDIPPQFVTELTMGAARLVSPTGVVSEGLTKELMQGTAQEKMARALGFWGIKATGSSQQNIKNLHDMFERQGEMAQHIRNTYYEGNPKGNTFEAEKSAQPSGGAASGFSVTAPNGKTYKFNNQNDLNAFKQKAGL